MTHFPSPFSGKSNGEKICDFLGHELQFAMGWFCIPHHKICACKIHVQVEIFCETVPGLASFLRRTPVLVHSRSGVRGGILTFTWVCRFRLQTIPRKGLIFFDIFDIVFLSNWMNGALKSNTPRADIIFLWFILCHILREIECSNKFSLLSPNL